MVTSYCTCLEPREATALIKLVASQTDRSAAEQRIAIEPGERKALAEPVASQAERSVGEKEVAVEPGEATGENLHFQVAGIPTGIMADTGVAVIAEPRRCDMLLRNMANARHSDRTVVLLDSRITILTRGLAIIAARNSSGKVRNLDTCHRNVSDTTSVAMNGLMNDELCCYEWVD